MTLTRDLKRLSAISRSPLLTFFKESLKGIQQIRALQQEATFLDHFCQKLYQNHQIELEFIKLRWWYNIQNGFINSILTGSLALGAIWLIQSEFVSAPIAGLALTYALMFAYMIPQIVQTFGDVQNQMTSVERLEQYATLSLEPEASSVIDVPTGWPQSGKVEFKNVQFRYDETLPTILDGVSFVVEPQSTLGIVGRTGAGKSTLFQALFRFSPLSEGQILIDGVDISKIPLKRLREQINIVPQDPILYSGTVQSNLDPHEQMTGKELLAKLDQMYLVPFIESLQNGLMTQVEEDGKNLSQGQRQLICLARTLLLDTKILLMDEATASLDLETEKFLHQVLGQVYHSKTVLLIAHRPESLRNCDKIITLSEGKMIDIKSVDRDQDYGQVLKPAHLLG